MAVSLEKIDMLMERANISYKEAKEALEKYDGDMVEALIYLESNEKTSKAKSERTQRRESREKRHERRANKSEFCESCKKTLKKMHKTSFIIYKKGHRLLDIPLTIAVLIILFTLPASLFLLILPYLFGYQIMILNPDGSSADFSSQFSPEKTKKHSEEKMQADENDDPSDQDERF